MLIFLIIVEIFNLFICIIDRMNILDSKKNIVKAT